MDGVSQDPRGALPELARRVARRLVADGPERAAPGAGVHVAIGARRPGQPEDPRSDRDGGSGRPTGGGPDLLTVESLTSVPDGGSLRLDAATVVTPLARDEAERRGIRLLTGGDRLDLALASDHGGFELKAALVEALRRRGRRVHDLGTHDARAVDYPDFAEAAAREVAAGRVAAAIVVDGAGIGSAMAANKVAGVRAANGVTVELAVNAREHNHANLLTLGAGHHDLASALAVVDAFLATPFGPGRHARRVAKLDALDRVARAEAAR